MFYEIKLKVEKENSKGEMKEVIEHFITDVGLFAGAEANGLEQYNGNCDVISITRSNVVEIVNEKEEGKPFYKATLIDIFIDDNGKPIRVRGRSPYGERNCGEKLAISVLGGIGSGSNGRAV